MCFYNSNSKRAMALAKRYGRKTDIIEIIKEIEEEQYKINAYTFPYCPIITKNKSIEAAIWGLIPSWTKSIQSAKDIRYKTLNARSETVFELPSFSAPIMTKRCLFPSTGFFEFHHTGKNVTPYYIYLKNEEIFSLGAIFDVWQNPKSREEVMTFSVLTTPANYLCSKIHNGGENPFRMPLILNREDEERWLDNSLNIDEIKSFFEPMHTNKMDAHPISKDFLKKKPNDASIIAIPNGIFVYAKSF